MKQCNTLAESKQVKHNIMLDCWKPNVMTRQDRVVVTKTHQTDLFSCTDIFVSVSFLSLSSSHPHFALKSDMKVPGPFLTKERHSRRST